MTNPVFEIPRDSLDDAVRCFVKAGDRIGWAKKRLGGALTEIPVESAFEIEAAALQCRYAIELYILGVGCLNGYKASLGSYSQIKTSLRKIFPEHDEMISTSLVESAIGLPGCAVESGIGNEKTRLVAFCADISQLVRRDLFKLYSICGKFVHPGSMRMVRTSWSSRADEVLTIHAGLQKLSLMFTKMLIPLASGEVEVLFTRDLDGRAGISWYASDEVVWVSATQGNSLEAMGPFLEMLRTS